MSGLITTTTALAEFVEAAQTAPWVALDTEFMRERTYYPELCLVQAAIPDQIVLIDALADMDSAPLSQLFAAPMDKILHAPRQDQEVLQPLDGVPVSPLFDTQRAAALCGQAPQAGYARLVEDMCGVALDKGATRTDWTRRPLRSDQLSYAADDVRYLGDLRDQLAEKLQSLGRWEWFCEDMREAELCDFAVDPNKAWKKIKGAGRLPAPVLLRVMALAAWRERKAMDKNRPRRWILKDEALQEIAFNPPQTQGELAVLRGVEPKFAKHQGEAVLRVLKDCEGQELPAINKGVPDQAVVKQLQKVLRARAEELELDASVLASRQDLIDLMQGKDKARLRRGWRAELLADELLAVLA